MRRPAVLAVVGPTASGKSATAELVAERLGTSVVSVDAMQVYRGMDVGTAKTPACERRVPLLMVDVCDPLENYSVSLFQRDARSCVDALLSGGRDAVLCGGTGLYLDAVIDEMEFPSGEKGGERRRAYEGLLAERGPAALHDLLAERDPRSARLIHPNNSRRVVRALEMLDEGTSYAEHHEGLLASGASRCRASASTRASTGVWTRCSPQAWSTRSAPSPRAVSPPSSLPARRSATRRFSRRSRARARCPTPSSR